MGPRCIRSHGPSASAHRSKGGAMKASPGEAIARALLYEGYILYPYRASALKNRHRFAMGGLAPGGNLDSSLRAECLVAGDASAERPNPPAPFPTREGGVSESPSPFGGGGGEGSATLLVQVRFLHPLLRTACGSQAQ